MHVGEQGSQLGFAGRGDNDGDDGGHAVERGVEKIGGVIAEGNVASSFGAGVGERKIGGVGMDLKEHGGGANNTAVVGEFGEVAEKTFLGGENGSSRIRLEGGEGGDSFKGGDVIGSGII